MNAKPTLTRGSAQHFYITKVKDDVRNNAISVSVLVLKTMNADLTQGPFTSNCDWNNPLIAGKLNQIFSYNVTRNGKRDMPS